MKKKLAGILRRWASWLSPETIADPITREPCEARRFQVFRHYSRQELRAMEGDADLAFAIDLAARRDLLKDMAAGLVKAGAITFHTEPECCPDSHDVLIATCTAIIK